MQTLAIVQRRLTHYRVPLFNALQQRLQAMDIKLRLLVGQATQAEHSKQDQGQIDWALNAPCHYALGGRLCWQSLGVGLQGVDFVVIGQENRLLNNLPLLLAPQPFRVALWGHGADLQAGPWGAPAQWFKQSLAQAADWWFAYTEISAQLMRHSAPAGRITLLNNAVDTEPLQRDIAAAREVPRAELRRKLGLGDGPALLFIGSLYDNKRLDLLLDVASRLQALRGDVQLAVAGAGPLQAWLGAASAGRPWIHLPGAVQGMAKARWLAAADVMVNPGVVGLGLLDAFAAGLPFVAAQIDQRSPELAYLEPCHNGLLLPPDADNMAHQLLQLLADRPLLARLRQGAAEAAARYTLPAMVERFAQGVQAWRQAPPRRELLR